MLPIRLASLGRCFFGNPWSNRLLNSWETHISSSKLVFKRISKPSWNHLTKSFLRAGPTLRFRECKSWCPFLAYPAPVGRFAAPAQLGWKRHIKQTRWMGQIENPSSTSLFREQSSILKPPSLSANQGCHSDSRCLTSGEVFVGKR